jgi:hypothetical protein
MKTEKSIKNLVLNVKGKTQLRNMCKERSVILKSMLKKEFMMVWTGLSA